MPLEIRPMGPLEVLGEAATLLGRRFPVLLAIAAVFNVPLQLAIGALYDTTVPYLEAAAAVSPTLVDLEPASGSVPVSVLLAVFLVALSGLPWTQLAVTHAVAESALGRDCTFDRAYRETFACYGAYATGLLLASLGVIVGLCLLLVPGLYLGILWAAIAPVVVIERTGGARALGRSRELVGGNWWHAFAVLVVSGIAGGLAGAVCEFVFRFVFGFAPGLAPLLGAVVSSATLAFYSAVTVVLYFDLRSRGRHGDSSPGADDPRGGVAPGSDASDRISRSALRTATAAVGRPTPG